MLAAAGEPAESGEASDPYAFLGLESVSQVPTFRVSGFNAIDDQSLIVWGVQKRLYLFILDRRCMYLRTTEAIAISGTGATIQAGFDQIDVLDDEMSIPCRIARMYVLSGRPQIKTVKAEVRAYHKRLREEQRARKEEE
jgi:hypothetical protein